MILNPAEPSIDHPRGRTPKPGRIPPGRDLVRTNPRSPADAGELAADRHDQRPSTTRPPTRHGRASSLTSRRIHRERPREAPRRRHRIARARLTAQSPGSEGAQRPARAPASQPRPATPARALIDSESPRLPHRTPPPRPIAAALTRRFGMLRLQGTQRAQHRESRPTGATYGPPQRPPRTR